MMVCDSSYMTNLDGKRGAAAQEIHCTETDKYEWVSLTTTSKGENEYKSELKDLYAILKSLTSLYKLYQLKKGEVEIVCNNKQYLYIPS